MINYLYDCYSILNKVYSKNTFIKQAISDTLIEEKNRSLTIKTVYGVLDKDIELSYYMSCLCDKNPKLVIRTILKISMYAIKYLEKKPYAVTENAVELTKKLGKGGTAGFVNAVLRKFINTEIDLPNDKIKRLSIENSYPEFAVQKLIESFGIDKASAIIKNRLVPTTVVFYDIDGENYLKQKGYSYSKTPFYNVFKVDNFTRNEDYDKGLYTFQALGSVAICDIIDKCQNLLDTCSAPGGKSVRLSYKCENITSWDIHEHRALLIKEYAKRMHRENIVASVNDAKVYNDTLNGVFDSVLVDAPCSGLGVINDNPDIKLNRSLEDLYSLNKEQFEILNNVKKYVKVGGFLYYSTCSVLDCENVDIINKFLQKNENFELQDIDSPLEHLKRNKTINFLPDISGGLGFFVAKLKRIK